MGRFRQENRQEQYIHTQSGIFWNILETRSKLLQKRSALIIIPGHSAPMRLWAGHSVFWAWEFIANLFLHNCGHMWLSEVGMVGQSPTLLCDQDFRWIKILWTNLPPLAVNCGLLWAAAVPQCHHTSCVWILVRTCFAGMIQHRGKIKSNFQTEMLLRLWENYALLCVPKSLQLSVGLSYPKTAVTHK